MNASQAMKRSAEYDEIVTLDAYSVEDFETLFVYCDDSVLANGMWEFWDMKWRVHMPEKEQRP